MLTFNHDNLPKTRRSILIVCLLIIAAEKYLSASTERIDFGGLVLEITKPEFVTGLFIGLLYLWIVMIAQFTTGPMMEVVNRWKNKKIDQIKTSSIPPEPWEDFSPSDDKRDVNYSENLKHYLKNKKVQDTNKLAEKFRLGSEIYSSIIFATPVTILTILIGINYFGLVCIF